MGDKEGAIEYYKKTIEVCKEDFWAHINLGSIYEERDMLQEAYRMFSKALQIAKDLDIKINFFEAPH